MNRRTNRGNTQRLGRALRSATLLLAVLAVLLASPAATSGLTSTTIVIDGSFSDWAGVRLDPDNTAYDTQIPDDPDYPSQADRDVYLVNVTYDSEYIYMAWRRTSGGIKAITFGAYIDLDGDGLLQNSDKVVVYTVSSGSPSASWNGGQSPSARILNYNQARTSNGGPLLYPAGDPMGGDGDTPDGWAQWQDGYVVPAKALDAHLDTVSGIECEARVAWSDLGLEPGSPIIMHFASGNGESWGTRNKPSTTYKWIGNPPQYLEEDRGQVEDNVGGLFRLIGRSVSVTPNRSGGAAPGSTVTYAHSITNNGNVSDTFALSLASSAGWAVVLVDESGNPISAVTLARGESRTVIARVTIPAGVPEGTRDTTTLTAASTTDATVTGRATDTTTAGRVSVTPDRVGSASPGGYIEYLHAVTNSTGAAGTFDLTATSLLGFPVSVRDTAGNPLSALTLGDGASAAVVLRLELPAGTAIGTQDITHLTAALQTDPGTTASARDVTTVRSALDVSPDRAAYAGVGTYVSYRHTVTNSSPDVQTLNLAAASSLGWPVSIFDADGVTPLSSIALDGFGGSRDVVVRVFVPTGAGAGAVDTTTLTASAGALSASATATTTVRRLATYDTPGYGNQTDGFTAGETVYARATGLAPRADVRFVWKNPSGTIVRTSSIRTVDTQGMAFDDLPLGLDAPTGGWIVELQDSNGNLLESSPFTVAFRAEITALSATDAATVGSLVAVTSSTSNDGAATITNSTMTYVLWWDDDGSGAFSAGDTYIGADGMPRTWDGVSAVSTHVTSGIDVAGGGVWSEPVPWTISNEHFPNQGIYRITATWRTAGGMFIDEAITELYAIPVLGWPLALGAIAAAAAFAWRRAEGRSAS